MGWSELTKIFDESRGSSWWELDADRGLGSSVDGK